MHLTMNDVPPCGLFIDDDQTMVFTDFNHRIIQWKIGDMNKHVFDGVHAQGNRSDQLRFPTDVLIDKKSDSLIACDHGNRRVVRWSRKNYTTKAEILLDDIACLGLAMDDQIHLYISDVEKHEVRRYQIGDKDGTVVAGGHGNGTDLNQLNWPTYIFVDRERTVYVTDHENHRVIKWKKDTIEGIIVAGGHGAGDELTQLKYPYGLFVDALDTIYVADNKNYRVMRWPKGAKEGTVIVGRNGHGKGANQFYYLWGLSFDRYGNLYIVDTSNIIGWALRIHHFLIQ